MNHVHGNFWEADMIEKFKKREWADDGTNRTSMDYTARPYGWVRAEE